MPGKRSVRARQPSLSAVQAAATEPPARKRARRAANPPAPRASTSSASASGTSEPLPREVTVPPHLLETLIARVVDEVTARLAPQQNTQSPASVVPVLAPLHNTSIAASVAAPQVPSSTLTEVPVAPSPNELLFAFKVFCFFALKADSR